MATIMLAGKSQKGKNRIREHGKEWIITERRESVLFSPLKGWIDVQSKRDPNHLRWILAEGDQDFVIESL